MVVPCRHAPSIKVAIDFSTNVAGITYNDRQQERQSMPIGLHPIPAQNSSHITFVPCAWDNFVSSPSSKSVLGSFQTCGKRKVVRKSSCAPPQLRHCLVQLGSLTASSPYCRYRVIGNLYLYLGPASYRQRTTLPPT